MVLNLDVEVIRAKQIAIAERQFPRLVLVPIPERPRNLARRTTRKANETLVILLQQFVVRPRLVVEAFQLRLRRQLDEILVALVVFRQKREVVLPVVQLRLAVEARAGRHVHLAAQDRLDAPLARFFIELDGAVKYAVIGEADSRKTQFLGAVHQLRHAAHAVEQAVVRMQMQVGKLLHEDTPLLGSAPRQVGNLLGLEYLDGDENESEISGLDGRYSRASRPLDSAYRKDLAKVGETFRKYVASMRVSSIEFHFCCMREKRQSSSFRLAPESILSEPTQLPIVL